MRSAVALAVGFGIGLALVSAAIALTEAIAVRRLDRWRSRWPGSVDAEARETR